MGVRKGGLVQVAPWALRMTLRIWQFRGAELRLQFSSAAPERFLTATLPRDAPHQAALDGKTRLVTGLYRAGVVRGRLTGTFTIAGQHSPLAEFIRRGTEGAGSGETMESSFKVGKWRRFASGAWT